MFTIITIISVLAIFVIIPLTFLYSLFKPEKLYIRTRKNENGTYSRSKFYSGIVVLWVLAVLIGTWAANRVDSTESHGITPSSQSDSTMTPEAEGEESFKKLANDEQEQIEEPIYALSEYKDINEDNLDFMIGVWTVQVSDRYSDEQKVHNMGNVYFGSQEYEEDGFKRRDLAKNLLLQVNEKIDTYQKKYKNGYSFKVPIRYYDSQNKLWHQSYDESMNESREIFINADVFNLNRYDFEREFFPIQVCLNSGEYQGFFMKWEETDTIIQKGGLGHAFRSDIAPKEVTEHVYDRGYEGGEVYMNVECGLSVESEDQARKIEEVIVSGGLASKGYVYYNTPINKGEEHILFEPVLADITYFNKYTDEVLATKQFTW